MKHVRILKLVLAYAQMCVNARIAWRTSQILVLSVGYMYVGAWVSEAFRQTKVDHVDLVASFADTHQKVIRFDITMDESFCKVSALYFIDCDLDVPLE